MRDPKLRMRTYQAPLLPIPKDGKWNGLVYLHGLLPKVLNEHDLNQLVVSSGDFGLAYLTERWAARFVGELFRNYIVCFVGYSIGDPVLRYMMDALAADRMLGVTTLPAYAFAHYTEGKACHPDSLQGETWPRSFHPSSDAGRVGEHPSRRRQRERTDRNSTCTRQTVRRHHSG